MTTGDVYKDVNKKPKCKLTKDYIQSVDIKNDFKKQNVIDKTYEKYWVLAQENKYPTSNNKIQKYFKYYKIDRRFTITQIRKHLGEYLHEVIDGATLQRMHFDIDIKFNNEFIQDMKNNGVKFTKGTKISRTCIEKILGDIQCSVYGYLNRMFESPTIEDENFARLVYNGTRPKERKISLHVIYPNLVLRNYEECKAIYNQVIKDHPYLKSYVDNIYKSTHNLRLIDTPKNNVAFKYNEHHSISLNDPPKYEDSLVTYIETKDDGTAKYLLPKIVRNVTNSKCKINLGDIKDEDAKFAVKYFKAEGYKVYSNFIRLQGAVCPTIKSKHKSNGLCCFYRTDKTTNQKLLFAKCLDSDCIRKNNNKPILIKTFGKPKPNVEKIDHKVKIDKSKELTYTMLLKSLRKKITSLKKPSMERILKEIDDTIEVVSNKEQSEKLNEQKESKELSKVYTITDLCNTRYITENKLRTIINSCICKISNEGNSYYIGKCWKTIRDISDKEEKVLDYSDISNSYIDTTFNQYVNMVADNGKPIRKRMSYFVKNMVYTYSNSGIIPYVNTKPKVDDYFNTYVQPKWIKYKPEGKNNNIVFEHSKFYNHIWKYICANDDKVFNYLMDWIAHIIQYPNIITGVCIFIYSKQGVGKDTLANFIAELIGHKYYVNYDNPQQLNKNFNALDKDKLLIVLNELDKRLINNNKLKSKITAKKVTINKKYMPVVESNNYANWMMFSNYMYAVMLEKSNRKIFPIKADSSILKHFNIKQYFNDIYDELKNPEFIYSAYKYFHERKIDKTLRKMPDTKFTQDLIGYHEQSSSTFIEWLKDNNEIESLINDNNNWVPTMELYRLYTNYCNECKEKALSLTKFVIQFVNTTEYTKKRKRIKGVKKVRINMSEFEYNKKERLVSSNEIKNGIPNN